MVRAKGLVKVMFETSHGYRSKTSHISCLATLYYKRFFFFQVKFSAFCLTICFFIKKKDGKPLLDNYTHRNWKIFFFYKNLQLFSLSFFIWLMQDIIYEKINFTCLVWLVIAVRSKCSTKSLLPLGTLLLSTSQLSDSISLSVCSLLTQWNEIKGQHPSQTGGGNKLLTSR